MRHPLNLELDFLRSLHVMLDDRNDLVFLDFVNENIVWLAQLQADDVFLRKIYVGLDIQLRLAACSKDRIECYETGVD